MPPGEVVGAAVGPGHRLRDTPPPTPSAWESVPVVIVGGGVAGLSAAWRLARAGFDRFVLLEIEPAAGGTARAGTGECLGVSMARLRIGVAPTVDRCERTAA